jgi:hypothetical protein
MSLVDSRYVGKFPCIRSAVSPRTIVRDLDMMETTKNILLVWVCAALSTGCGSTTHSSAATVLTDAGGPDAAAATVDIDAECPVVVSDTACDKTQRPIVFVHGTYDSGGEIANELALGVAGDNRSHLRVDRSSMASAAVLGGDEPGARRITSLPASFHGSRTPIVERKNTRRSRMRNRSCTRPWASSRRRSAET